MAAGSAGWWMTRRHPTGRPTLFRSRRLAAKMYGVGAVAIVAGAALVGSWATFGTAASTLGGTATFEQSNTPITGTNLPSTTQFDLVLPANAACSENGTHGALYYSFLVPSGTNLGTLTFHTFPPQADQGTALAGSGGFLAAGTPGLTPSGLISPQYASGLEMAYLIAPGGLAVSATASNPVLPSGTALIAQGATSANYVAGIAC